MDVNDFSQINREEPQSDRGDNVNVNTAAKTQNNSKENNKESTRSNPKVQNYQASFNPMLDINNVNVSIDISDNCCEIAGSFCEMIGKYCGEVFEGIFNTN